MSSIDSLLASGAVALLSWSLIHFLWQGSLLALFLAVAFQLFQNASSRVRYATACVILASMAACPLATIVWLSNVENAADAPATPSLVDSTRGGVRSVSPAQATLARQPPDDAANVMSASPIADWYSHLHWLALLWLAGATLLMARLALGWFLVGRLRRQSRQPAIAVWQIALQKLSARMGITWPVSLVDSSLIDIPGVIGWRRPVILLPASAIDGLTPAQVEGLLAHELAHVRRHDYLVNLWQTGIEATLFYHPAIWWVSAKIREERERCCDDLAIATCGDRIAYALALAVMEEIRSQPTALIAAATDSRRPGRSRRISEQF
jgi:beta-lactamase regulating signal transducer with metallopeptidase domain